jgi:ABC-type transport system, involved in lipoprotein release, permease component
MNRNNNSSILSKIANKTLKTKKAFYIVAIIAIALTTMMFCSVFTIGVVLLDTAAKFGVGFNADLQGIIIAVTIIATIICSGYLIINNIFQTSIRQDIQFYGLLKTIGTTKRQISKIIYKIAFKLCLIGIPIGLLIGYFIGIVVVPFILTSLETTLTISFNPLIFIGATLFSIITVFFSTSKSAKIAKKVSPMQALKYIDIDNANVNHTEKGTNNVSIKMMANNQLKKNKKLAIRVVASVSIGLILMNSFYILQQSYDADTYVNSYFTNDVALNKQADNQNGISLNTVNQLKENNAIQDIGIINYYEATGTISESLKSKIVNYYTDTENGAYYWLQNNPAAQKQFEKLQQDNSTTMSIYGIDSLVAGLGETYLGNVDINKFVNGKYVIAYGTADNGSESIHYNIGEQIILNGESYELMALVEPPAVALGNWHSDNNKLNFDYAISPTNFSEMFNQNYIHAVLMNGNATEILKNIDNNSPEYSIITRNDYHQRFHKQVFSQVVLGYTLGFITAVVGILNFINSMLSSVLARRHEFAVLESIGMTKKQIRQMLVYEGINYLKYIIISSLIGSTLAAFTFVAYLLSNSWVANFQFSLLPFVVIAPLLLILSYLIPLHCFNKTQSHSLTTRLRA